MNWLRKLLVGNLALKLLSLGLAIALWATFGGDPITERVFRVPVEFGSVPPDLEILPEQASVELRARGPSRALRKAAPSDFSIRIELSPIPEPGERTFVLSPPNVESPPFLRVVRLTPPAVRVALEKALIKEVPILPGFSGEVGAGRRIKEYRLKPSRAKITGPRSHVEAITAVSTDPVNLNTLSNPQTVVTTAYVSDPLVRFVGPQTVEITVEFEPQDQTRSPGPPGAGQ